MADDKSKRGLADRARINVHEPYELEYWTKELGVQAHILKEAVSSVGTNVEKVRSYLRRSSQS
jgi:hypothetical protein